MPSNKDILEAQRYNRRRLVTAFMAGTPGGRELEARPLGRPLIVGAVLALVLVLVAVLMGRLNPGLRTGWENDTLVVVKGTGARYFTIDGVLRPVANVTSARLLADPSKFEPSEVEASTLAGIPRAPRWVFSKRRTSPRAVTSSAPGSGRFAPPRPARLTPGSAPCRAGWPRPTPRW